MRPSRVILTLAGLVRINSVNPAYENGCTEAAVVAADEEFAYREPPAMMPMFRVGGPVSGCEV